MPKKIDCRLKLVAEMIKVKVVKSPLAKMSESRSLILDRAKAIVL